MTHRVDENWKKTQQNTFTKWVNSVLRGHLKSTQNPVNDLQVDLGDGIKLAELLDTLAHPRKVGKIKENPGSDFHKIINLGKSFEFMEKEKIKLVNIGASDINQGNLKLILGLIWTLIRHYQIRSTGRAVSTKDALLAWVNTQVPDQKITNFTVDWNSGIALCALVNRIRPGACPNYGALDRKDGISNCSLGMSLAEEKLNIPKIMDPEDLSHPDIDSMSVMTYISFFCKPTIDQLLIWVQSKIPDRGIKNFSTDWNNGVNLACLVDALNPGIIPRARDLDPHASLDNLVMAMREGEDHFGVKPTIKPADMADPQVDELNIVTYLSRFQYARPIPQPHEVTCSGNGLYKAFIGREATFDIDASKAGTGELLVIITSEGGKPVQPIITPDAKRRGFFKVTYVPNTAGKTRIEVKWGGFVIPASPFSVDVLDPANFSFTGAQITGGHSAKVGRLVTMEAKGLMDVSDLYVLIQHPDGHTENAKIVPKGSGQAECSYTPVRVGKDEVFAKIAGVEIPGTPFQIDVVDPSQCSVTLRDPPPGKPVAVNSNVTFAVMSTTEANLRGIIAEVKMPKGVQEVSVSAQRDGSNIGSFTAVQVGGYQLIVTCAGENIRGSPINFTATDASRCALLDTLPRYLQVGKSEHVNISTKGAGEGSIEAKSSQSGVIKVDITKSPKGDMYTASIAASSVGESAIELQWNGVVVPPTPHTVFACDATKCSAYGPGLTSGKGKINEAFEFTVQARGAGKGEVVVKPKGPKSVYAADVKKNSDDTYTVSFTSFEAGVHTIEILWGNEPIPNSPFKVDFSKGFEASQFTATGEGLQKVIAREPAKFMLVGPESGLVASGILEVKITGRDVESIMVNKARFNPKSPQSMVCVTDNGNGSYAVEFSVPQSGDFSISIVCDKEEIPGSPFKISVLPPADASKCRVFGPAIDNPNTLVVGKAIDFKVDSTKAGTGELEVAAIDPRSGRVEVFVAEDLSSSSTEKLHTVRIDPKFQGSYKVEVFWSGTHIPHSPLQFVVNDPSQVMILDLPDSSSFVARLGEAFTFKLDTRKAGKGELKVAAKLDSGKIDPFDIKLQPDGVTFVSYTPKVSGRLELIVTFSGVNILPLPWTCDVANPGAFEVHPPAKYARLRDYVKFVISGLSKKDVRNVTVNAAHKDHNAQTKIEIGKDGTAVARFTGRHTGEYQVNVLVANKNIAGSPFTVKVADPNACTILGEIPTILPVGHTRSFEVDTKNAGPGELSYEVQESNGEASNAVDCVMEAQKGTKHKVNIKGMEAGTVKLSLKWAGFDIPRMPLEVCVPSSFQVVAPKGFGKLKEYVKFTLTGVSSIGSGVDVTAVHSKHNATVKSDPAKEAGSCVVRFTPKHIGQYTIQAKHKGQHIDGSPFTVDIADPDSCTFVGALPSEVHVGETGAVTFDASKAGSGTPTCMFQKLSGEANLQPKVKKEGEGKYSILFVADGIGVYRMTAKWAGYPLTGSNPFDVSFLDSSNVTWSCSELEAGLVKQGEMIKLTLDCKEGGTGVPVVKASGPKSQYNVNTSDNEDGTFTISFTPLLIGKSKLEVFWGGKLIQGCPVEFEVVRAIEARTVTASGDGLRNALAGIPASIKINTPEEGLLSRGVLKASMEGPEEAAINLTDNGDCTYGLEFVAPVKGDYKLTITSEDQPIYGSPFAIKVKQAPSAEQCAVIGLGDEMKWVVNDPVKFSVNTTKAGEGSLNISATQPNGESINVYAVKDFKNGKKLHLLKFDPEIIGRYVVIVKWEEQPIPGCPFEFTVVDPSAVKVSGLPPTNSIAQVNEAFTFSVDFTDAGDDVPNVVVSPGGTHKPITLDASSTADRVYTYKYTPTVFGHSIISVEFGNQDIKGSPFKFQVVDPSSLSVSMPKKDYAITCEPSTFFITGKLEDKLSIMAHGPSADLAVDIVEKSPTSHIASFIPVEPGAYEVFVEYASSQATISRFTINVADPSKCQILGDPPGTLQVGTPAEFTVKTVGAGEGCLTVLVNGEEDNDLIDCVIENEGKDTYTVKLTGKVVSESTVEVQWADVNIPKCPFKVNVCDANCCKAFGQVLMTGKGKAGEAITFTVVAQNAGKGKLAITAKGPTANYEVEPVKKESMQEEEEEEEDDEADKAEEESDKEIYEVSFTPWEVGKTTIHVLWSKTDIPKSPFTVDVKSPIDTVCNATGEGLKRALAGQTATFTIISSEVGLLEKNALRVSVMGVQSHAEVVIKDKNDGTYIVEYVPPTAGAYVASVAYYDRQIPGGPFKVMVVEGPQAEKCRAYGPALHPNSLHITGNPLEFYVDTAEAGSGELRVYIQGPGDYRPKHYTAIDDKGVYSIKFDAQKVGKYYIVVAWAEKHIPGSPFKVKVHPGPDAKKVKVYGSGLQDGHLGAPGEFVVETKKAGIGTLLIRVHGLKDTFKIEAKPISETNPRTLSVCYNPTAAAEYVIFVRWSGVHVEGSPFTVHVRKPGAGVIATLPTAAAVVESSGSSGDEASPKHKAKLGSSPPPERGVLDSSFAQQPPSYQAAKRRSTAEGDKKKPGKKQQRRSKTPSSGDEMGPVKIVRSPSGAAVHVSPIAPSMKMKANPSFSAASAASGQPEMVYTPQGQLLVLTAQGYVPADALKQAQQARHHHQQQQEEVVQRKVVVRKTKEVKKVQRSTSSERAKEPSSPTKKRAGPERATSPPRRPAAEKRATSPPRREEEKRATSPPPKKPTAEGKGKPAGAAGAAKRAKSPPPKGGKSAAPKRAKSPPPKRGAKSPPPKGAAKRPVKK